MVPSAVEDKYLIKFLGPKRLEYLANGAKISDKEMKKYNSTLNNLTRKLNKTDTTWTEHRSIKDVLTLCKRTKTRKSFNN